jgi:DNA-binding transcriptional LysR family regulator
VSFNSEEIEALVSIVESGSFKAAANKLHKSQSSISYAIKILEQKLGFSVFVRQGHSPELTDAGRIVYNKALALLKISNEIKEFGHFIAEGIETKISVTVTAVTPTPILMKVLQKFNQRFPQTQIELNYTTHEEPIEYLLNNSADIVVSSGNMEHYELEKSNWYTVDFLAVSSPNNPACLEGITEEDLNSMTHIVVGGRKTLEKKVPANLVQNSNVWHVQDFLIKKELLCSGLGWGSMPKLLIERELEEEILVPVKAKPLIRKPLYLIRRKSEICGPAQQYLWGLFKQYSDERVTISLRTLQSYPPQDSLEN